MTLKPTIISPVLIIFKTGYSNLRDTGQQIDSKTLFYVFFMLSPTGTEEKQNKPPTTKKKTQTQDGEGNICLQRIIVCSMII